VRLFLVLLALIPLDAQLIVDTYAGGVIRSGVPANTVALGTISGITWDPSGNIVFCDTTFNVIRRVNTNGQIETIAGTGVTGFAGDGGQATSAFLNAPTNPIYDSRGNLYFFDSLNLRIRRIDPSGVINSVAGDGQIEFAGQDAIAFQAVTRSLSGPLTFAIDTSGTLHIAEQSTGRIRLVNANGEMGLLATTIPDPTSIVVDPSGNLYIASAANPFGTIYRISANLSVTTFATFPTAPVPNFVSVISADAAGNVYVIFNGKLFRYAPDGTSAAVPQPSNLFPPLAIDPKGNLAFASGLTPDAYVSVPVIQTFSPQSVLTTVAGASPQPAPDGTPLRSAWFLGPISIAFSHTGDLYIGEFGACLIRKISAAGVLSTFAGTGTCGYPSPSGTAKTANLVYPVSIAVDSQDNVWVADYFLNLYSISQAGVLSSMIKTPVTGGKGFIAVDGKSRVYVVGDFSFFRVLAGGVYQNLPFGAGGLGADSSGNVYFTGDQGTYVVNDDASVTLKYPKFGAFSMAFDPSGSIWGNGLSTQNASGNVLIGVDQNQGFWGDGGPLQSAGNQSASIGFGSDGNLYFADGGSGIASGIPSAVANARIRRVTGVGPSIPPVVSTNGIVNAASYAPGPVSPGELVSIFGSNFGVDSLQVSAPVNNRMPFTIGRTKVLFNGIPGAMTAITSTQINVFVPYEVAAPLTIQVQVDNILSAPATISLAATAPGLSSPILNQDGTLNTSTNPAPRGSIVSLYGTGLGAMSPQLLDGYLAISTPYSTPINPPTVTIGGQTATILYAGDAPTFATGVFQINATVPTTVNTGLQPVSLGSSQVTVFVK
jgi:uncharacterized protein (TIGR03437 family)